jgi:hypothetical protein
MVNVIENTNIQVDIEFLDHSFTIEVPKDIDLEELFEIIEKFIFENPEISIDLKTLSKTILDTEYYNLILKQNNQTVLAFDEIQIGIPLKIEMESDAEKKRFFTKKHLKSTFRHLNSISLNEFIQMFNISNMLVFKQKLKQIQTSFPIEIKDDILIVKEPFTNTQLKAFTNKLVDFME